MPSPSSQLACPPRWATPRRPERATIGHRIANVAAELGQPLMPWQQMVADVGGEIDETGRPYYRQVIFTVPRQSGKTTISLAWMVDRALLWGKRQRIAYTMQNGAEARNKMLTEMAPLVLASPLRLGVTRVLKAAGDEAFEFRNGSRIELLRSGEASGHGRTLDLGVIDEAFADEDDRREQAMVPGQMTRRDAQILVCSTAGTAASAYLNRKVADGRAAVLEDAGRGIAYFEWSAPEEWDPDDPSSYAEFHPAVGLTAEVETILADRKTMSDGEFRRAYGNQQMQGAELLIGDLVWAEVVADDVAPEKPLTFALDVLPDRSAASIAVADTKRRLEVIEQRAGVGWVVEAARSLCRLHGAKVALDAGGPAGSLAAELEPHVVRLTGPDVVKACGNFYDGVHEGKVAIRRHGGLDRARLAAQRKRVGDAFVFDRRAAQDVTPLLAIAIADYAARTRVVVDVSTQVF